MFEIIPGILESSWFEIEHKINLVRPFAKSIHIDIIDGIFIKNKTFIDPTPFHKYAKDIILEVHMMVEEPEQYIDSFGKAGFRRFLGHIEKMSNQKSFLNRAKKYGNAGLAIDGPTPISQISTPLDAVDSLLIYSADRVGFSNAMFKNDRLNKIKQLDLESNKHVSIEVDGGINDDTIVAAKNAGANRFVTTSFLFKHDPNTQYKTLHNLLHT